MRIAALILFAAVFAVSAPTGTAWAQPAPKHAPNDDIIGSLLDPGHKTSALEEEEPDTAGQKQTRAGPDVILTPPAGRSAPVVTYSTAPSRQVGRPVHIEETGRTPDRPPNERDMAYELRVRASFAAAEGFQGPLDGGWTLSSGGDDLFALQIVDKPDRLEGVWRDLRRRGSLNSSGLVAEMQRQGQELTVRFVARPDGRPTVATLHAQADGRWAGNIEDAGERKPVVLRRTGL